MRGLIIALGLDNFITEFAIKQIKPDYVAFLATDATVGFAHEVAKKTKVKDSRTFFIKNIFSTTETIQEFFNAINWLKDFNTKEIYIDATNCITVIEMATYTSASLIDIFKEVLGNDLDITLVYVHCDYKIKEDGIASEIRGTEKLVELEKPIDSLSFVLALDAIRAFNQQRYEQSKENFFTLAKNTTGEKSILYEGLGSLSAGYEQWDKMNIEEAAKNLEESKNSLKKVKGFRSISGIISKIENNIVVLGKLKNEDEKEVILDLYSNALRRINENRFDDALARLYACIERITQFQLKKYGIETKSPDFSKLPADIIDRFKKEVGYIPNELELKKNALLLHLLKDPVGEEVAKIGYKTFIGLVGIRNNSILAHGIKPVSRENFSKFKERLTESLLRQFMETNKVNLEELENHSHLKIKGIDELLYKDTMHLKVQLPL